MQKPFFIYAREVERTLYEASSTWEGIDTTLNLVIEPLSWDNTHANALAIADSSASPHYSALLARAHRFLQMPQQEVQIFVARLQGEVAGYAVLRLESNKVAYLRNAMTVPVLRNRGVYLSLVAHRLAVARAAGCSIAVLQAQTKTSSPILIKRGFTPVCQLVGLARKHSAH